MLLLHLIYIDLLTVINPSWSWTPCVIFSDQTSLPFCMQTSHGALFPRSIKQSSQISSPEICTWNSLVQTHPSAPLSLGQSTQRCLPNQLLGPLHLFQQFAQADLYGSVVVAARPAVSQFERWPMWTSEAYWTRCRTDFQAHILCIGNHRLGTGLCNSFVNGNAAKSDLLKSKLHCLKLTRYCWWLRLRVVAVVELNNIQPVVSWCHWTLRNLCVYVSFFFCRGGQSWRNSACSESRPPLGRRQQLGFAVL